MNYLRLPRVTKTPPSIIYENSIYSGKYDFLLNHNIGDLYQIYIKGILSTSNTACSIKSDFGLKLLKSIRLHNNVSTVASLSVASQIARMDLANFDLYSKVHPGIQPANGVFASGPVIVYIPCFFFFSDEQSNALDLYGRKQLYLEIVTNSSKESMGMSIDLTSASFEMITYNRMHKEYTKVPKQIKNGYSNFYETPVLCVNGSTSVRVKPTCPYPTFMVHFLIVRSDSSRVEITNVKIDIPNMTIMDIDSDMNYLLSEKI